MTRDHMQSELNVWILSDGIPGHINQAYGLAKWMSDRYRMSCLEIPAQILAKQVSRLWMPFLLRQGRWGARMAIASHRLGIPRLPPFAIDLNRDFLVHECGNYSSIKDLFGNSVDLILSAGGNTSFINVALATWLNCDNLLIGSRRRLDSEMFTAHLTLEPVGKDSNIVMDLAPTLIDPMKLRRETPVVKKKLGLLECRPVYLLIIGGDGAGFRYERDDWLRFVRMMKKYRDQDSARWLVTTSRRTTQKNDALIKEMLRVVLPEDSVLEQVIWSDTPRKIMQTYLSVADRIFVTADSMSMITECISTEKSVTLLYPRHFSPNERYRRVIDKFLRLGFCSQEAGWHGTEDTVSGKEMIGNNARENKAPKNKANVQEIRSNLLDRLEKRIGVLQSCNYQSSESSLPSL
uniref:Fission protein ELM1 n=1 Tax=Candidatus Kentrum sp. LFY TaxID=2126342 RepID=A0A450W6F3_9GAMM|nr:MAG: hypothetical protein BECKLFY1418C_GA0070996_100126 [Candidatus Kentron sp. LFY]